MWTFLLLPEESTKTQTDEFTRDDPFIFRDLLHEHNPIVKGDIEWTIVSDSINMVWSTVWIWPCWWINKLSGEKTFVDTVDGSEILLTTRDV